METSPGQTHSSAGPSESTEMFLPAGLSGRGLLRALRFSGLCAQLCCKGGSGGCVPILGRDLRQPGRRAVGQEQLQEAATLLALCAHITPPLLSCLQNLTEMFPSFTAP